MKIQQFPLEFLWGAATAPYQIEGTWNEDGHRAFFDPIFLSRSQTLNRTVKERGWWYREWIQNARTQERRG